MKVMQLFVREFLVICNNTVVGRVERSATHRFCNNTVVRRVERSETRRLLLPALVLFLYAACCLAATDDTVEVFVSIAPQKYLVKRIGNERVNVRVMLKPGNSPETYDPTPRQIAMLSNARIYFFIGVPFEKKWREKFRLQNEKMRIIDTCQKCPAIDDDPHTWTNPLNGKLIAEQIRDALLAEDQVHAGIYETNYQKLAAELDSLDAEIEHSLRNRHTDYFIVSHDAWSYYARRYGLKQLALESRGREKGPRGISQLVDRARRENIKTLFIQEQHPGGAAYTLAAELGAGVAVIDPLAENYIDNLRRITALIAGAIK